MRRRLLALLLLSGAACGKSKEPRPPATPAPAPALDPKAAPRPAPDSTVPSESSPIPHASQQLLVSVTADWSATDSELFRFERQREGGPWQPLGTSVASTVGKTGLAWGRGLHDVRPARDEPVKREGDGKSPAGVFAIGAAYGYDAAPSAIALPYQQSSESWRCVNDPASRYYNRVIDSTGVDKDWSEAEKMRRSDELYRLVIEIDHNRIVPGELLPVPQEGSCIFLHVWRKPGAPTIGCTAMALPDMKSLMSWLDPARKPHLIALPRARYQELRARWALPDLASADAR